MCKVTKLSLEMLEEKAKAALRETLKTYSDGAVAAVWNDNSSLADRLDALLASEDDGIDKRDERGATGKGRSTAFTNVRRIHDLA